MFIGMLLQNFEPSIYLFTISVMSGTLAMLCTGAGRMEPQLAARIRMLDASCVSHGALAALAAANTAQDREAALAAVECALAAHPAIALSVAQVCDGRCCLRLDTVSVAC